MIAFSCASLTMVFVSLFILFGEVIVAIEAHAGVVGAVAHLVLMHLVAADVAPHAVDNDFVLGEEVVLNFELFHLRWC